MMWLLLTLSAGLLGAIWLFCTRRRVCAGPKAGRARRPAQDLLDDPNLVQYSVTDLSTPSLSGKMFVYFTWFLSTRFGQFVIVPIILKGFNLFWLSGEYIPEKATLDPHLPSPHSDTDCTQENKEFIQKLLEEGESEEKDGKFRYLSVRDYYRAYREKRCTPVQVADAILEAIKKTNAMAPPLRAIVDCSVDEIRNVAEASADRWKEGKPLSVLDGVPVSIKAEFHTEPYAFRCGSLFEPIFAETMPESNLVKNFKEAGAIIIGLTNMQEFGTGVLGSNPNRFNLTARNPYNTGCFAGGSSSGSAVSVAAGLCPISLGADSGGSVRIPAALCGLFGLKPTHGLLDDGGKMPMSTSQGSPGPLCASALDTIIAMNILSRSPQGLTTLSLRNIEAEKLSGIKIGIYRDFFDHCDESVKRVAESSLHILEGLGAAIVDVKIPELEETRVAHFVTIFSEFANNLGPDIDRRFDLLNPETLLITLPGFNISATDFLNAQKQRTRAIMFLRKIFEDVDVIVTPTMACVAPRIDSNAISHGKFVSSTSGKLNRFAGLANFAGNPAISCPIGISSGEGLPVGLQFIGKWFDETTLLSIAWVMEKSDQFPATRPSVFCDILKSATKH